MNAFFKKYHRKLLPILDVVAVVISYFLSLFFTIPYFATNTPDAGVCVVWCIIGIILYTGMLLIFKLYNVLWLYSDAYDFIKLIVVSVLSGVFAYIANYLYAPLSIRTSALITIFVITIFIFLRLLLKLCYIISNKINFDCSGKKINVLIVGAGSAAEICIREIKVKGEYNIVGLIDDSKMKLHCMLNGIKVLGNRNSIPEICKDKEVDEILLAIPSLSLAERSNIVGICEQTKCKLKIIPHLHSVISEKNLFRSAREVQIDDLLYRERVSLDTTKIQNYIKDKIVMVTGGGGSIGSEICRQLAVYYPKQIVILDNYENNAYDLLLELQSNYPQLDIRVIIATVRDKEAIENAFKVFTPDIVFHAAAHKHVPLMESTPKEAIKNNVFGTLNIAQACIRHSVGRFVLISTDKAVNPTNIMGATKRICEMMIQTFNDKQATEFVAVRFGNVLGSNGSVIPIFKRQIESGGPVTLTHRDITRYFMTIPEAAGLVLQAGVYANNGEIFVLDMGEPVKIYDLAYRLITLMGYEPNVDIKIVTTGLRPGEKLYEELLLSEEGLIQTGHKKIHIAKPMQLDKARFYKRLLLLQDTIDTMSDEEIKLFVADLVPTYKIQN